MAALALLFCAQLHADAEWPQWEAFKKNFVQSDGRVIDVTFDGKSTSEGQSYGLFFALVANDRAMFDTILNWTSANLAGTELGNRLPAWYWGRRDDGSWGVKDTNSAADADLWTAYALMEAARLWKAPAYASTGRRLLDQIVAQEVIDAGASGTLLLPGPQGFKLAGGRFRLVPSYYPGFLFRYFAAADPHGPWAKIWNSFLPLAMKAFSSGIAPDAFVVDSNGQAYPDSEAPPVGSYDAIRVYTWAGISDPQGSELVRKLEPFAALTRKLGQPPEKVDPTNGTVLAASYSPLGYSGALLPFLRALGDEPTLQRQRDLIENAALRSRFHLGPHPNYYDQA